MIAGVGTDIARIDRFENKPALINRILTEGERDYVNRYRDPLPRIAGIWAAKESLVKALDRRDLDFKEAEVAHTDSGKPYFICEDVPGTLHLSISHEKQYATAVVIWEK